MDNENKAIVNTLKQNKINKIIAIIGVLVISLLLFVYPSVKILVREYYENNFVEKAKLQDCYTQAKIITYDYYQTTTNNKNYLIIVEYVVDGKTFTERVNNKTYTDVEKYEIVTLYYDKDNPSYCMLESKTSNKDIIINCILLTIGFISVIISIAIFIIMAYKSRKGDNI